ncbi:MAG TPA: FtsX-like permease family protein [Streptosporangiaceae bacterium]|nr:FtsX-like permease family protein [Streptosporangiaceae bacterium]
MGRAVLIWRLAVRDLRRRLTQSVLLLLVIAAATSTLALAFALDGTSNHPWSITRAATAGPDVMVETYPGTHPDLNQLDALAHAAGVIGTSGPYPMASPVLRTGKVTDPVFAEGRDETMPTIDRPNVTNGTWVRPGGVVIERGFADQLNVHMGSQVTLDHRPFRVVGIAVDTDRGANWRPQLVWVTRADAVQLAAQGDKLAYVLNLRLAHPPSAPAFASAHSSPSMFVATWQQIRSSDEKELTVVQIVLLLGTWLLGMLAIGSVAVLVGGRMIEQIRRAGLMKAAGGTPQFVAVVLLAENLFLALAATAIGLLVGYLVAPVLASPSLSLLGSANSPSLTAPKALIVVAVAVAVAVAATVFPALRAANSSTIGALNDPARPPRRYGTMMALSARLPVALVLGLLLAVRRPRRAILTTVSLLITDVMIVCALALHSSFASSRSTDVMVSQPGLGQPLLARVDSVVLVVTVLLVVLATINAIFITQATVLDAQRPSALARAFGATPNQVSTGLTVAQLIPALLGGILSVPAGIFLYRIAARVAGGAPNASLPVPWMAAVIVGTVAVVAALTLFPARAGARRPVAVVLRSD